MSSIMFDTCMIGTIEIEHDSIAVTERVIKTLKNEWLKRASLIKGIDRSVCIGRQIMTIAMLDPEIDGGLVWVNDGLITNKGLSPIPRWILFETGRSKSVHYDR